MLRKVTTMAAIATKSMFASDPETRNASRFSLAGTIAHWLGDFRMYKYSHSWPHHEEFLEIWRRFPEGSSKIKDKRFA